MRALGCTTHKAQMALLFPLLTLAVPAVVLGSLGAVLYTRAAAERNAAERRSKYRCIRSMLLQQPRITAIRAKAIREMMIRMMTV